MRQAVPFHYNLRLPFDSLRSLRALRPANGGIEGRAPPKRTRPTIAVVGRVEPLLEPRRKASGQAGLEPIAILRIYSNRIHLQILRFYEFHMFFFRDRLYAPGILKVRTSSRTVRVYNMEKTVCDMFRYRHKLGENLAIEGLKTYLARKDASLSALRKYAELCQVKTILLPYLTAIIT